MKKHLLSAIVLCLSIVAVKNASAQFSATAVINADSLVHILLGNNSSVQVTNATTDCPFQGQAASGHFVATGTNLGIDSGMMLTSGSIFNAYGPNDGPSTT